MKTWKSVFLATPFLPPKVGWRISAPSIRRRYSLSQRRIEAPHRPDPATWKLSKRVHNVYRCWKDMSSILCHFMGVANWLFYGKVESCFLFLILYLFLPLFLNKFWCASKLAIRQSPSVRPSKSKLQNLKHLRSVYSKPGVARQISPAIERENVSVQRRQRISGFFICVIRGVT